MDKMVRYEGKEQGELRIADDVVGVIAGLAATEVEGVAGMSGSIAGGIAEMLGKKNLAKGVKVQVKDREASVDAFIIVQYGSKIPDVALAVQENVRRALESMTGLTVTVVNVHVQGVAFENESKEDENRPR